MKIRTCLVSNSSSCSCVLIGVKLPKKMKLDEAKVFEVLFGRAPKMDEDELDWDDGEDLRNGNEDGISYQWSEKFGTHTIGKLIMATEGGHEEISLTDGIDLAPKIRAVLDKLGISSEVSGEVTMSFYTEYC